MKNPTRTLKNEKGMATIETIPLMMLFVFLIAYEFGVFGAIHSGIMQSISARAYAFETFRNRSNLVYFRDEPGRYKPSHFRTTGTRTHGIQSELVDENDAGDQGIAAERPLRVGIPMSPDQSTRKGAGIEMHNEKLFDQANIAAGKRNTKIGVSPIWIQVQYGMCLNSTCGG